MIKKILLIAIVVLALTMLAGPFILTAQAAKTIVPFSYTQTIPVPVSTEVDVKWTPDYHLRIARGTYRTGAYSGPLGVGTIYWEAIISITDYENKTVGITTYNGHGIYRDIITITSGPYGKGTVEGIRIVEWDFDIARAVPKYRIWGNVTYQHGTDDLKGIRMDCTFDIGQYPPPNAKRVENWSGELILP